MHSWITLIVAVLAVIDPICLLSVFNHTINTYEVTDYKISFSKVKRSLPASQFKKERGKYPGDVEVKFKSFNKSFHLILHEDLNFQKFEFDNFSKYSDSKARFFEGILKENPFQSSAIGYLKENHFSAIVQNTDSAYYIEPANLFLVDDSYSGKIVVYKNNDIHNFQTFTPNEEIPHKKLIRKRVVPNNLNTLPVRIYKARSLNENRGCEIQIVADHTLYEYFKRDEELVKAFLYLHGKYADNIFRRTDFNGDGKPDGIRIIVKSIFIYRSINDPNYPMARTTNLKSFLTKLTLRVQNYCLAIGMCFKRDMYSPVIGQAFKPGNKPYESPRGGICQKPVKNFGTYRSFNTAAVTIKSSNYGAFPLITTLLAFTHEMGHSFGSDHDPFYNLACSPGSDKGFYIMYPRSVSKIKYRNAYFSPCSKKEMYDVILKRGSCLKDNPAICGNGIREGEEECDCGWTKSCSVLDRCCTPSDAQLPEKGCTFRRQKGLVCSPRENPCCTKECKILEDRGTVCYYDDKMCMISFCDGKIGTCPKPKSAPDKYPCQELSKSCNNGVCNSTICRDNKLKDCVCKTLGVECVVCCLKGENCVSASDLGFITPKGEKYVYMAGTKCNSERFQCDGSGNCVDVESRKISENGGHTPLWWGMVIISVVFLILIFIFCHLLRKHLF